MNPREAILDRARRALSDVPHIDPALDVPIVRPVRSGRHSPAEVTALFAEQVADYRAVVVRTTPEGALDAIHAALAGRTPLAGATLRMLIPPGFPPDLLPTGVQVVADSPDLPIAELDRCDGVLSTARLGIARTGTIVLDHGPGQGRRAASLIPDLHVCVIRADQVVPDVPEAVAALEADRPQTWISGPSATSDIELDRVEGVHGPRTLHVILVESR